MITGGFLFEFIFLSAIISRKYPGTRLSFSFDAFSSVFWNSLLIVGVISEMPQAVTHTAFLPTIFHVLCDDIDWLLGDDSEEADEACVLQVLHHVGLCQEGFHRHCAYLQVLNCHLPVVIVDT